MLLMFQKKAATCAASGDAWIAPLFHIAVPLTEVGQDTQKTLGWAQ